MIANSRRSGLLGTLLAAVALAACVAPAAARTRGDSPSERERTAVELCARELNARENGRGARVDRVLRSDYRKDRVYWDGYMTVQRSGPDRRYRLACVVDFAGRNRIVSFEASGGSSGGGGTDTASRACWSEAERRGYGVADTSDSTDAGRHGRLVILRVGRRGELLCLYRRGADLYRPL